MKGRDIDGSYVTSRERRVEVMSYRDKLRDANLCINGSLIPGKPGRRHGIVHGPVVPGTGKCARCCEAAKRSR